MDEALVNLQARVTKLLDVIGYAQRLLKKAPKGSLRINTKNGKNQFFHVTEKKSKGVYISVENGELARDLAQKDYLERLIKAAEKEIADIDRFLERFQPHNPEMVYSGLNSVRRQLVSPIMMDDEEFAKRWAEKPFEENPYKKEERKYATKRGDYVRSKSEAMIADAYFDFGIPYKYDYPVRLYNGNTKYIDFVLLDVPNRKIYYHEHMGMMDSDDYRESNLQKLNDYQRSGLFTGSNLILTFDTKEVPLDMQAFWHQISALFGKALPWGG